MYIWSSICILNSSFIYICREANRSFPVSASREPTLSLSRRSQPFKLSTSFPTSSVSSSTRIKVPNADDGTSPPDSETAATSSARLKISGPTTARWRGVEMGGEMGVSGESSVVGGSIERRFSVRQTENAFKYKEVHIRKCAGYIHVKLLSQSRSKCVLNPQVCVLLLVLHKWLSGTKCCHKLPPKLVGYLLLVIKIHFLEWLSVLTKHFGIQKLSIPFVFLHLVLLYLHLGGLPVGAPPPPFHLHLHHHHAILCKFNCRFVSHIVSRT